MRPVLLMETWAFGKHWVYRLDTGALLYTDDEPLPQPPPRWWAA
jgi:hypothetical protein